MACIRVVLAAGLGLDAPRTHGAPIMKTLSMYLLVSSLLTTLACSTEEIAIPESMRVTQLQTDAVARDVPAAAAFSSLAALVAQRQHLTTGLASTASSLQPRLRFGQLPGQALSACPKGPLRLPMVWPT